MGIGRENLYQSLVEHPFTPISRRSTESAKEGAGGDLHPDPGLCQSLHRLVVRLDPGQALGMRKNGYKARYRQTEEQSFQTRGRNMMGGLDQHIARVSQGQQMPGT